MSLTSRMTAIADEVARLEAALKRAGAELERAQASEQWAWEQLEAARDAAGWGDKPPEHFANHVGQLLRERDELRAYIEGIGAA